MDWSQVLTIILSNLGIFIWIRTESYSYKKDLLQMAKETKDELKKFHQNMCPAEKRHW